MISHQEIRQLGRRLDGDALDAELARLDLYLAFGQRMRGNRAEEFFRELEHLFRLDVAGDNQRRIVWRVPFLIPAARIGDLHVLQVVHPAYHRRTIRMRYVNRRHQLLVQLGMRIVIGARTSLFHHHLGFLDELLLRKGEIDHAIGF